MMILGALLGLCIVLYVLEIVRHRETKKELRESDLAVVKGVKKQYLLETKLNQVNTKREYREYPKF